MTPEVFTVAWKMSDGLDSYLAAERVLSRLANNFSSARILFGFVPWRRFLRLSTANIRLKVHGTTTGTFTIELNGFTTNYEVDEVMIFYGVSEDKICEIFSECFIPSVSSTDPNPLG
jgi:hypothetical protein